MQTTGQDSYYVWGEGDETWSYFCTMSSSLIQPENKKQKIINDEITSPKNTCTP